MFFVNSKFAYFKFNVLKTFADLITNYKKIWLKNEEFYAGLVILFNVTKDLMLDLFKKSCTINEILMIFRSFLI